MRFGTTEVNLKKVLLHLLLLLQVSQHALQQLQAQKTQTSQDSQQVHTLKKKKKKIHFFPRLTIVLPAPLGPTISTELLSPWIAVRLSSSRRCLQTQWL